MHTYPDLGFVVNHELQLSEAIPLAGEHGFDFVEVKMNGEASREALDGASESIVRGLEDHGLDLLVHLPYQLDIGSPHEHVRAGSVRELVACLECAAALDATKASVHAESRAWLGDGLRRNVFESVRRLEGTARELDVELCAENPLRGTVPVGAFDELFSATEASMTLDTGHARCDGLSSGDIAAFVADHGDRISHFHLNDTYGESDDHLPFGAGTVEFVPIFEALPDDWDGTFSLELKPPDPEDLGVSKRHLERALTDAD